MPSEKVSQNLQKELDNCHVAYKKARLAQKMVIATISSIAILGFISQQRSNPKETTLAGVASLALICWSFLRASNMNLNSENRFLYSSLNKFNETRLNFEQEKEIITNVGVGGIAFMGAMMTSFIPILASGMGKMNPLVASTAASLILISDEVFLKHMFKKNNKILRNALPPNVSIRYQNQRGN